MATRRSSNKLNEEQTRGLPDELPSNEEVERAVEYLVGLRADRARMLLKSAGLATSGTKADLRSRLLGAVDGKISPVTLIQYLDESEGWGNQHVVLFDSTESLVKGWKTKAKAVTKLKNANLDDLLEVPRPIWLPEEPTLSQVRWTKKRLLLVWVQKKTWQLRMKELDQPPRDQWPPADGVIYKAYQLQERRAINFFDWNLVTGEAALLMQALPKDEYADLQQKLLDDMSPIINAEGLETKTLGTVIKNLEKSDEVSRRAVELTTERQTEISIRSRATRSDAYDDPTAKRARDAIKGKVAAKRGQFYWLPQPKKLDRSIGMRVYPKHHRFSIHGECSEAEVTYLLSRIRNHCK